MPRPARRVSLEIQPMWGPSRTVTSELDVCTVARCGETIGQVHAAQVPADHLSATEESVGVEQLARMLRQVLDLG